MPANLKNITRSSAIALATATALACSAITSVHAADDLYDPGVTEVEFGTGWYIRGDIGITGHEILRVSDSADPIPGTQDLEFETTDTDNVFSIGAGVGFRFSDNLRGEISYSYMAESEQTVRGNDHQLPPAPCSNAFVQRAQVDQFGNTVIILDPGYTILNCVEGAETSYFLQTLMANAYYDFDTSWKGFRPFVGVGAGLVRNQFVASTGNITCTAASFEQCNPTDGGTASLGEAVHPGVWPSRSWHVLSFRWRAQCRCCPTRCPTLFSSIHPINTHTCSRIRCSARLTVSRQRVFRPASTPSRSAFGWKSGRV